jgi:hypothetical protein
MGTTSTAVADLQFRLRHGLSTEECAQIQEPKPLDEHKQNVTIVAGMMEVVSDDPGMRPRLISQLLDF